MPGFDADLIWLAPVVFVAGLVDAIAGGGGLITVPAYLLAGLPPTLTLGTNKFVSAIGTAVSTIQYCRSGRVLWRVALIGLPCSLAGGWLAAHWVSVLDEHVVRTMILAMLPFAAAFTFLPRSKQRPRLLVAWRSLRLWIIVPVVSLLLGWYDGMFGPGTGTLLLLMLFGFARLDLVGAQATARIFNLCSNVAALAAFLFHGNVLFRWALPLSLFGIAGQYVGSHLAIQKGDGIVRGMLIITCTLLFLTLLSQTLR